MVGSPSPLDRFDELVEALSRKPKYDIHIPEYPDELPVAAVQPTAAESQTIELLRAQLEEARDAGRISLGALAVASISMVMSIASFTFSVVIPLFA